MFQSKLFRRLFSTYILVIFTCFIMYSSFIIYENHQINTIQIERKSEIQLDEVENIVDQRLSCAQNIVQNLRYSTVMRQLYMSSKLGTKLDSYILSSIQNEMRNTMAMGGLSIFKTVIFLEGSDRAYSSSGVIILGESYKAPEMTYPYMFKGTVKDACGLEDSKRYSFNEEFLLYCDSFTYQYGSSAGTVCLLFDLKDLENDIQAVLQDGYSANVLYQGQALFEQDNPEGKLYERQSDHMSDIVFHIYASDNIPVEGNVVLPVILSVIITITILFVGLAYSQSKKYYMPIDHLEQMVSSGDKDHDNELENIIADIQNLIGEKNGYREKMLTIAPYAKTGMLHSMITGNMAEETVHVFSEENYLDLIKPYFIVSVMNFAFEGKPQITEKTHKQKLNEMFQEVAENFSTEEQHIVYYFKDIYNVFLITNFEQEKIPEDLFVKIHHYVQEAMEKNHCYVTMGIDRKRDDMSELKEACRSAMKALDGILADGRGKVFFIEQAAKKRTEYYFPVNCREKLKRCLQKQDKNEIHLLLFDIYKKNLDLDGAPEMYRALVDEFHLTVTKTLREITELDVIHMQIEKYQELATLQEIFDYYDAALLSIIDVLQEQEKRNEEASRLEEDIVSYIEANYCDENLSMQSVMDQFGITNKYFSYFCKSHFGTTYLQYIQMKRIQKAQELLRENRYTLAEIGSMCGYANPLTFRRNFKSITGVNPSDYQKN